MHAGRGMHTDADMARWKGVAIDQTRSLMDGTLWVLEWGGMEVVS